MNSKTIITLAIALIVAIISIVYLISGKEERYILSAFHNADMSIPDYVKVNEKFGNDFDIEYGLGGRTCTSYITIEEHKVTKELAKECSH